MGICGTYTLSRAAFRFFSIFVCVCKTELAIMRVYVADFDLLKIVLHVKGLVQVELSLAQAIL